MDWIGEENYREEMQGRIEPELARLRRDVCVPVESGEIRGEAYEPAGTHTSLLVLHGYTESAEKFREMTWYFLQAGFAVYLPDQRGHGRSLRYSSDTSLTHVETFWDYVGDAEAFFRTAADPEKTGVRAALYAHSMGGAVGAFLMMRRPDWFKRCVLTALMIAAVTAPLPRWAGGMIAEVMCCLGLGRKRAFVGRPYDPDAETFERSFATSRARFAYYTEKRRADAHLQNCAPTYRWVREALRVTPRLLDSRNLARIQTPVLLCQARRDTVVCLPEHRTFVSGLKDGRLEAFDAKHEIYLSGDAVLRPYVDRVVGFLRGEAAGN